MKLMCVEAVHLVHSELNIRRDSIGWNSSRGGTHIFTKILNRGDVGPLKKRKIAAELCAWNPHKALEIEGKYKRNKKPHMCSDMKAEFRNEINKLQGECKINNTKLPQNCKFYKLFVDCYSTNARKEIVEIIEKMEQP